MRCGKFRKLPVAFGQRSFALRQCRLILRCTPGQQGLRLGQFRGLSLVLGIKAGDFGLQLLAFLGQPVVLCLMRCGKFRKLPVAIGHRLIAFRKLPDQQSVVIDVAHRQCQTGVIGIGQQFIFARSFERRPIEPATFCRLAQLRTRQFATEPVIIPVGIGYCRTVVKIGQLRKTSVYRPIAELQFFGKKRKSLRRAKTQMGRRIAILPIGRILPGLAKRDIGRSDQQAGIGTDASAFE